MNLVRVTAFFTALGLSTACSKEEPLEPIAAADLGRHYFHDAAFSQSAFNAFSCATCHTDVPGDAKLRPGFTLVDSAFRPSFWGGYEARLIDAVDFCLVYFMRGDPLDAADPRGRALYEYLVSISPDTEAPALPLTIVPNATRVDHGDADRGAVVWNEACAPCHGAPHTGRGRLTDLASIVPESSIEFAEQLGVEPDLVLIEKIRHGQFFGVGGNMPPFALEALSNEDLGALLAYLAE